MIIPPAKIPPMIMPLTENWWCCPNFISTEKMGLLINDQQSYNGTNSILKRTSNASHSLTVLEKQLIPDTQSNNLHM